MRKATRAPPPVLPLEMLALVSPMLALPVNCGMVLRRRSSTLVLIAVFSIALESTVVTGMAVEVPATGM